MKKKLIVLSSFGLMMLGPVLAFAQNTGGNQNTMCVNIEPGTFQGIMCLIGGWFNTLVPILIALGVVYFVWGVITYMIGDDEEAKAKGKNRIIYGIIGLVVIVAMWGLVSIVTKSFGLSPDASVYEPPCIPGTPGCAL